MKKVILLSAALILLLSSCTSRMTDFTVISTKNFPLESNDFQIVKGETRVSGSDLGHIVLYFPVSFPNLKEAIDNAIQSYPGCVGLADGVVKSKFWWALLYGQNKYVVEGTPLLAKKTGKLEMNVPVPPTPDSGLIFSHEVKKDETLDSIAKIYNVSVGDIIRWNGLTTSNITPGMLIKVIVK